MVGSRLLIAAWQRRKHKKKRMEKLECLQVADWSCCARRWEKRGNREVRLEMVPSRWNNLASICTVREEEYDPSVCKVPLYFKEIQTWQFFGFPHYRRGSTSLLRDCDSLLRHYKKKKKKRAAKHSVLFVVAHYIEPQGYTLVIWQGGESSWIYCPQEPAKQYELNVYTFHAHVKYHLVSEVAGRNISCYLRF